jgi:hypothetical protein
MLYFSPSTGGFYDSRIHAELPADKVEVTAAERDEALNALAPDQRIAAGPDGKPVAAAAPVDDDAALRRLRIRRDRLLRDSDHSQMPDFPIDAGARAAWAVYRQALRDLPASVADPRAVEWPTPPTSCPSTD